MNEPQPIVLVLPRFTPWMKRLSILVVGVWLAMVLAVQLAPRAAGAVLSAVALRSSDLWPHLQIWRLVTHPWFENPLGFGAIFSVLSLWLIGSPIERAQGLRRVIELLVLGTLGGTLAVLAVGALVPSLRDEPVIGLGGFNSALLAAMGFLYAEQPVSFFGIGPMKGRHLALGLAAITVLLALVSRSASGAASIGGLVLGGAWMLWVSRRGAGRRGGERGGRARRTSGPRFRVVPGGRADDGKNLLN